MTFNPKNRVQETSTTTGTGTLTLAGAVTGFQTFAAIGNANTAPYHIEAVDGNGTPTGDWECGIGTYTASGTTLARTTVRASSNSGSAVSFSAGTKRVACSPQVEDLAFLALANTFTATQTVNASLVVNGTVLATALSGDGLAITGITANNITAGALAPPYGGTGVTFYAIGDMLYASASNTLTRLTAVATGNALISGGVTTAPSWGKVGLTTHITGTLGVANGGTGDASLTAYAVLCGGTTTTGAVQSVASVGTSGQVLTSGGASALPTFTTLNYRTQLTGAATYYVRTDGSDSNDGSANDSAHAFLTIQKAVNVASAFDLGLFTITINVADGTYTGAVTLNPYVGGDLSGAGSSAIVIQGNSGTPTNVVISPTSATCFTAVNVLSPYYIKDMRLKTTTSGYGIICNHSFISFNNIDFNVVVNDHILCNNYGIVTCYGNYSISGGAALHWDVSIGGTIVVANKTITVSASITLPWASAAVLGLLDVPGNTYSIGAFAVTGKRYSATTQSLIFVNGGATTLFPGTVVGTTATQGLYA